MRVSRTLGGLGDPGPREDQDLVKRAACGPSLTEIVKNEGKNTRLEWTRDTGLSRTTVLLVLLRNGLVYPVINSEFNLSVQLSV